MSELTTIERLLLPLVRRFVSLWVRPVVLPNDVRERFAPGRPVVYVLEKRGVVDAAVLEYVCRDRGLGIRRAVAGFGALSGAASGPVRPAHRSADAGGAPGPDRYRGRRHRLR